MKKILILSLVLGVGVVLGCISCTKRPGKEINVGGSDPASVEKKVAAAPETGERQLTLLAKNAQGYAEYRHERTGIIFVLLPGGKFRMGSPESEAERESAEGPVHEVTLSPFLIAKYEVSQAEWEKVMGSNPSHFKGATLPVEHVSWDDARSFCSKTALALPSEAQWEYACRAGTETPFSFGATITPETVNYGGTGKRFHQKKTLPVTALAPNVFGLHQMHGNVWEWCEDIYDESFYSKPAASGPDPVCTTGSVRRVSRGGSWISYAGGCRSAVRLRIIPAICDSNFGFRPARPFP